MMRCFWYKTAWSIWVSLFILLGILLLGCATIKSIQPSPEPRYTQGLLFKGENFPLELPEGVEDFSILPGEQEPSPSSMQIWTFLKNDKPQYRLFCYAWRPEVIGLICFETDEYYIYFNNKPQKVTHDTFRDTLIELFKKSVPTVPERLKAICLL